MYFDSSRKANSNVFMLNVTQSALNYPPGVPAEDKSSQKTDSGLQRATVSVAKLAN